MKVPVVLHPIAVIGLEQELARFDSICLKTPANDREVVAELEAGAPILITQVWDDRFLRPSLKWVQSTAAGFDQFPVEKLDRLNVVLTTAAGVHARVAEGVFGLLLGLTTGIAKSIRDAPNRVWADTWTEDVGPEISGSTIGIIGLGSIGEAVARRAAGWEVDLVGVKRHPDRYSGVVERVVGPERLLEVCELADILVVTAPASPDTFHLIGARELAALGSGWFVNVGRGSVVDEQALITALKEGSLLGAGLDVFEQEPLPHDSPLWDMHNVIVTPHNIGKTDRYGARLMPIFRANFSTFIGERTEWMNRVVGGRCL